MYYFDAAWATAIVCNMVSNKLKMSVLKEGNIVTCLTVVHPVEYDLWCSVPARHNITSHFTLCLSCQTKVQDLRTVTVTISVVISFSTFNQGGNVESDQLTFNSQFSFTARLLGFRS